MVPAFARPHQRWREGLTDYIGHNCGALMGNLLFCFLLGLTGPSSRDPA